MPAHSYSVIELVGTAEQGVDQAIRNAIARASQTLRGLDWFEVVAIRGQLAEGQVRHTQVTLKVGFRLEDPPGPGNGRQAARRPVAGSTNPLVEDAIEGPAEPALEASGEAPAQTPAQRLGDGAPPR
jgi:flavin-binding protein dodecin